jgi:hypothetical protein
MIDLTTIGAGGGSIARYSPERALTVGPHSAGAELGPACYGRGGAAPTVTDSHLVLGVAALPARRLEPKGGLPRFTVRRWEGTLDSAPFRAIAGTRMVGIGASRSLRSVAAKVA